MGFLRLSDPNYSLALLSHIFKRNYSFDQTDFLRIHYMRALQVQVNLPTEENISLFLSLASLGKLKALH